MPDTRRKAALDAVSAALAAITGVPGLSVENNRDTDVENFPTLVVQGGAESTASRTTGSVMKTLNLQVEVYVAAIAAADLRTAFDLVYGKVIAALEALGSPDGAVNDIRHTDTSEPAPDTTDGANPSWAVAMLFEVDYWVAESDPYNP